MTPEPAPHTDAPAPQGQVAWAPERVAGTSNHHWLPVVLPPPLIALLTLGLTFFVLAERREERAGQARAEL